MGAPQKNWSISSLVLTDEAEKLGLEVEIVNRKKNLFYIRGKEKSVLFKSTDFGVNSSLGYKLADDKELAYTLLEKNNFPIAKSWYVKKDTFADFHEGKIQDFRFPLIIKPTDEGHGNSVMMDIRSFDELHTKLESSLKTRESMIIQEQITGDEFRVLVLFGKVILAINRIPAHVIGNGTDTVEKLIEDENKNNPLRGDGYDAQLAYIQIDDEMQGYIGKKGYTLASILKENEILQLRGNSNIGTGGTMKDYTQDIHPETQEMCAKIAELFQLGFCGIDIITSDISKPLSETHGIILELGGTCGIGADRELTSVNTGRIILQTLFGL